MQFVTTAFTDFICVRHIVNDSFPWQIVRQWFALGFVTRVTDGFVFSVIRGFFQSLLDFIEQTQLVEARFAALPKPALPGDAKLLQEVLVLLREMFDLGIFASR